MDVAMVVAPTDRMKETQGEKRRTKERQWLNMSQTCLLKCNDAILSRDWK